MSGLVNADKEDDNDIYSDDAPEDNEEEKCCCPYLPKRYLVALLSFFGFVNVYALRVNLSVALVAMVSNTTKHYSNGTEYVVKRPEFDWDPKMQGFILSSFFYGYIVTQIPGGWLAAKYGGKNLFGFGILMTALFTLLTPPAARTHVYLLVIVRMLEGLCEGVAFPCIYAIWRQWAPPLERSKLATISFSGPFAGTVLGMPVSGIIAHSFGWPWVFYFFGILGVFWSFFWFTMITDSPKDHPKISRAELNYITSSLSQDKPERMIEKTPWKEMFTSMPVWAIIVAHTSENWGWYTLLTQLPTYLKKILNFSLKEAGVLSALPYLAMVVVVQCGGRFADFLRSREMLSTTAVRKVFNSVGFMSQAAFLVAVGYTTNKEFAIVGLTLAVGFGGFTWSGFPVNHLDVAPRYASILFGITNCVATLPGIFSPMMVGFLTENESQAEWRIVFLISACVYLFGMIFFAIFASGQKQDWADPREDSVEDGHEMDKLLSSQEDEDNNEEYFRKK